MSIKMQLTMSIDWIDKLLAKHSAKNPLFRYSGTSQTFSDIFDQPFNQFLPRELVREGEVIIIFYFFFYFPDDSIDNCFHPPHPFTYIFCFCSSQISWKISNTQRDLS